MVCELNRDKNNIALTFEVVQKHGMLRSALLLEARIKIENSVKSDRFTLRLAVFYAE